MSDLRELYQTTILDHNRNPRNFGQCDDANRSAEGHNPICGDQLRLYLRVDDSDAIVDASFDGSGCAISKASASLMTESVQGKPIDEVETLYGRFHDLVTGEPEASAADQEELGKLAVFAGVAEYPARVKCASLAWHVLDAALEGTSDTVTTE